MSKKKNLKKAESKAKKSAVETLRFQAHWGLKKLGHDDDMFHQLVDAEVDFIAELELVLSSHWQLRLHFIWKGSQPFIYRCAPRGTRTGSAAPPNQTATICNLQEP